MEVFNCTPSNCAVSANTVLVVRKRLLNMAEWYNRPVSRLEATKTLLSNLTAEMIQGTVGTRHDMSAS